MSSFLILGHGTEDIVNFNQRKEVPVGYTLVTIAECGIITRKEDVCPMVEAFTDPANEEIFQNPRIYKSRIRSFLGGKDVHIYEAGKKYPKLEVQLFIDFVESKTLQIFKSGLYRFPCEKSGMQLTNDAPTFCESLFQTVPPYQGWQSRIPEDFPLAEMYEGSLYPTLSDIKELVKRNHRSGTLKNSVTVPIETLFEKGGPGVYYFVVCRSPKSVLAPDELFNRLDMLPGDKEEFKPYFVNNWASQLNTIIPHLEAKQNALALPGWAAANYTNTIQNYKKLQKVPLLRTLSIEQQGKGRRMRKTKRVRKVKTSTRRRKI